MDSPTASNTVNEHNESKIAFTGSFKLKQVCNNKDKMSVAQGRCQHPNDVDASEAEGDEVQEQLQLGVPEIDPFNLSQESICRVPLASDFLDESEITVSDLVGIDDDGVCDTQAHDDLSVRLPYGCKQTEGAGALLSSFGESSIGG